MDGGVARASCLQRFVPPLHLISTSEVFWVEPDHFDLVGPVDRADLERLSDRDHAVRASANLGIAWVHRPCLAAVIVRSDAVMVDVVLSFLVGIGRYDPVPAFLLVGRPFAQDEQDSTCGQMTDVEGFYFVHRVFLSLVSCAGCAELL